MALSSSVSSSGEARHQEGSRSVDSSKNVEDLATAIVFGNQSRDSLQSLATNQDSSNCSLETLPSDFQTHLCRTYESKMMLVPLDGPYYRIASSGDDTESDDSDFDYDTDSDSDSSSDSSCLLDCESSGESRSSGFLREPMRYDIRSPQCNQSKSLPKQTSPPRRQAIPGIATIADLAPKILNNPQLKQEQTTNGKRRSSTALPDWWKKHIAQERQRGHKMTTTSNRRASWHPQPAQQDVATMQSPRRHSSLETDLKRVHLPIAESPGADVLSPSKEVHQSNVSQLASPLHTEVFVPKMTPQRAPPPPKVPQFCSFQPKVSPRRMSFQPLVSPQRGFESTVSQSRLSLQTSAAPKANAAHQPKVPSYAPTSQSTAPGPLQTHVSQTNKSPQKPKQETTNAIPAHVRIRSLERPTPCRAAGHCSLVTGTCRQIDNAKQRPGPPPASRHCSLFTGTLTVVAKQEQESKLMVAQHETSIEPSVLGLLLLVATVALDLLGLI
ncbi:expressed unknown protein [Seminavis robusta]|uniref:Uncharacterized protein n=1 Tax=Seminavis robusta TaxID=568900 RepID=A0A9N8DYB2_9STRA|nr:expressed unknown protein [Seminavis robusta]|eukprot:Sro339_g120950.1 n/a (498) ;mRNA; r:3908-5401